MPPKTVSEAPKGATTRAAAAKQEDTGAASTADPPSDSSSMAEKMDQMLATVQNLSNLPSQVADLCSRLGALELRSGRTSPNKTPPTSSLTPPTAPPATVSSTDASRKPPPTTQSSLPTEKPAAAQSTTDAPFSAPAGPSYASQSAARQTAPPAPQTGQDTARMNPWSHWAPDVQNEIRFRLSKRGLSLTQLYEDPVDTASGPAPNAGRDHSSAPPARQLVCKHEILGSFDGDPAKLESFLSRVRAIGRKRIQGWEDAVLAAVPDALTGHAAKWHASLTKRESDAIDSLDALCSVMRRAFPINRAQLRSLARQRRWEPEKESAMNYYYDKVLLLRQAFGDTYAEAALAQDVADGLDASMRAYVRLPTEAPTLQLLQDSLAEWESVWREVHVVPLLADDGPTVDVPVMARSRSEPAVPSTATPPSTPLPPPPARPPRSEYRPPAVTGPPPQKSSASVASLALSYDPSRIVPATNGQPRMYRRPDSTRVMRLNRNCAKCGQQHFDFEHEHMLATGQLRMLETEPYDEVDESAVDVIAARPPPHPPDPAGRIHAAVREALTVPSTDHPAPEINSRAHVSATAHRPSHSVAPPSLSEGIRAIPDETSFGRQSGRERSASPLLRSEDAPLERPDELAQETARHGPRRPPDDGFKSGGERAVFPTGPGRDLPAGFHDGAGAMRGKGGENGPPPDPRPHGPPLRGVPLASSQERGEPHADRESSSFPYGDDQIGAAGRMLRLEPLPQFFAARTFPVDRSQKPLCRPTRREGPIVTIRPGADVGTGTAYRHHVPLTTHIRINDVSGTPLSSLLDTGASLSIIDRNLLETLGGHVQGHPMPVHGLGDAKTLGWVTIPFFIDSRDDRGRAVHMECTLDFHVLEAFAPGVCLGQDFISTHGVVIDSQAGAATITGEGGTLTFAVRERMPAPFSKEAILCVSSDVTVPARSHAWVPIDVGGLAPALDYTVYPRLSVTADESVRLAGPVAVLNASTTHILITNIGSADAVLERRTPVADALAARAGDVSVHTMDTFVLDSRPTAAEVFSVALETPPNAPGAFAPDVDVTPISLHDEETLPQPPDPVIEPSTVLVDGVFRVGTDTEGAPHADIVDVLRRNTDAFALDGRPGRVTGHEMAIDLRDDAAVHPEAPRRASPEKRRAMDTAIDQLLSWDVIEPSSSPISFPVLMVRQHEKWRFCVDYRQLNKHTIPDSYPLPTTDAVFNSLAGKQVFSSLDALRGYHQLGVRERDRWKTAFTCHRGLFQYKTVPFGLRNAPAVFQRLMDALLGELRWSVAVVYIDDVVLATATMAEHVRALDTLLGRARHIGLRFSPAKCTFGVPSLVLLGRKVSAAGVSVWADRARAVLDLCPPTTLRQLYHTMGLFGYYRSFVPNFATIASPLTKLSQGWRYEKVGDRYRLVSSEGEAVSADRVRIAWGDEQQAAFDHLKALISSPPVLAHPDPLRPYVLYVDASKDGFGAVLHQVFDVDDPARTQSVVSVHTADARLLPPSIARERWTAWLQRDRHFGPILRAVETGGAASAEWCVQDGVLVRREDGLLALPESGLPTLLRAVHDDAGHFGFLKTLLRLRRHFWRPGLSTAVRAWVRHCAVCMGTKLARRTGELDVTKDATTPFEAISIDLLLGFPRSRAGHDAVLVVLDLFSRMVLLEPCASTITAEGITAILSNRVLRLGWRPRQLVPDSEARLTGEVMRTLAASLRAELRPSLPHHHQANPVERAIQTVKHVLQALCARGQAHWDRRAVPAAELAINASPSVSTGVRPFDLVFVSHPDVVHAVFDGEEHSGVGSFAERLAAAEERLEEAREALATARRSQKRAYDASHAPLPSLTAGDMVFVRLPDRPLPGMPTDKLAARKRGPFRVAEILSPHRVRVELPDDLGISDVFDVSQLDAAPTEPDPFATHRSNVSESPLPSPAPSPPPPPLPPRRRQLPVTMRDFDMDAAAQLLSTDDVEALRGPYHRPRRCLLAGRPALLVEKPVAFLSRLTTPSERKLVAAELELCCLAWAFGRWLHLLEGAEVTVVTDHAPLGPMLVSDDGARYGPVISRCRALLMPHLGRLRFVHRPGTAHVNADSLSRLPRRPETDVSSAGGM